MEEYWDAFIKNRERIKSNYFTIVSIKEILEDFYAYLEQKGKIMSENPARARKKGE